VDLSAEALLIQVSGAMMRILIAIGVGSLAWAVVNERRMQKHRKPGVTYAQVTLRKDGAWRRSDFFTEAGLVYQRRAARWGVIGAVALLAAFLMAWLLSSLAA
jgi:hypothetical protein